MFDVSSSGLGDREPIDISVFGTVEDEEGNLWAPNPRDMETFEAIARLNPKPYRSSGLPTGHIGRKCADPDCDIKVQPGSNSVFCMACDNERFRENLNPMSEREPVATMIRPTGGDPQAEIRRRRKALQDHSRGISKAIVL